MRVREANLRGQEVSMSVTDESTPCMRETCSATATNTKRRGEL
jgi:hypothetical protein